MDVIHTALLTNDIDATLEFYVDGLGLERRWSFTGPDGVENIYLGTDEGAEIQFKYDPDISLPDSPGMDHIALGVDSTDDAFEQIREQTDCPIEREPTTIDKIDARVAFVRDPNGYVVEFVESL